MSSDVLSHFGALDELIQIIYEGVERFVLLSNVDDASWTIHLGLQGPEGRWWRGRWLEKDILHLTGSKASEVILEGFADKLADIIVKGQSSIGDWRSERDAKINLTLGSSDRTPIHMPLTELSPQEAASHATKVFWDIAQEAQSRKCRLNGPSSSYTSPPLPSPYVREAAESKKLVKTPGRSKPDKQPVTSTSTSDPKEDQIKVLKAQLSEAKKRTAPEASKSSKPSPPPPKLQGASLANPNKKARKYQAVEFESDED
ncbi:hypothetical protein PILCRDRAFT_830435 [Piloderma croceum F 1598]|uniref:Uncharacterized protein n=1 Tax=Piloderma croceum (strain F 1598) TaxID=765440 RepID=A0A0C3ABY6_PILCF|nr:hypothetical protein PILCRDRAFT_830435 [Piloderma croceum F 1598]